MYIDRVIAVDNLEISVELSDRLTDLGILELEYELTVTGTVGTPAVVHLAPEDCSPAEPDEVEHDMSDDEIWAAVIHSNRALSHLLISERIQLRPAVLKHEAGYLNSEKFLEEGSEALHDAEDAKREDW